MALAKEYGRQAEPVVRQAIAQVHELRAVNRGSDVAPYGCGIHPYLVAPSGTIDDWSLEVPAAAELLVGRDLLPTELVEVTGDHDFRRGRPIAGASMDNAFTDAEVQAMREWRGRYA